MFIVILRYVKPWEAIEPHLEEHWAFLDRQYVAGHFIASGPQVPREGGVMLVKSSLSLDELERLLAEDSFRREQVATYQIIEFNPSRFGAGVESAFGGS
ncbi:YciI family protein [Paraburkholderia sp. RL17-337-BIB-A]|uniref:YciI family protein n=1 Tax=Paraburkholderia sp. RL17-337-BIB-A TaxID=3031636 RepID=UPI0038B77173